METFSNTLKASPLFLVTPLNGSSPGTMGPDAPALTVLGWVFVRGSA